MTILDVIQKGTGFLSQRSVDSPRLQVELLLAHVLQIPRLQLYLAFDRKLTPNQIDVLRKLIRRRGERVPLQHLVGTAPFMHFNLEVNSHVLIPRPETETLVQIAVQSIPDFGRPAAQRCSGATVATLSSKCCTSISAGLRTAVRL